MTQKRKRSDEDTKFALEAIYKEARAHAHRELVRLGTLPQEATAQLNVFQVAWDKELERLPEYMPLVETE